MTAPGTKRTCRLCCAMSALRGIVLQNSQNGLRLISREVTKQATIADRCVPKLAIEVAGSFIANRRSPPHDYSIVASTSRKTKRLLQHNQGQSGDHVLALSFSGFDPMYGPAVRCKRFSSIWQMRSCINVCGARDAIKGPKPKETLNARASNLSLW